MIDSFDYEHENGDRTFYYGNIVFNTAGLISNIAELYEIYDAKTDKEYALSDLLNLKYYHYWLNQEIAKPEGYDDLYNGEIYEGLPPEPTHPGPQPEFKPSMTYDEYIELYGYGENFNYKEKYYYTYYNGYQLINPAEEIYDPEMVYYKESEA
jgi:hypothetical protein